LWTKDERCIAREKEILRRRKNVFAEKYVSQRKENQVKDESELHKITQLKWKQKETRTAKSSGGRRGRGFNKEKFAEKVEKGGRSSGRGGLSSGKRD